MQEKVYVAMIAVSIGTVGARRGYVDRKQLIRQQISDEARGPGGLGQAQVAVAEGVDDARRGPGASDRRQAVGQGRPETEPLRPVAVIEAGQKCLRLLQHRLGAPEVRRQLQAAEFDGAPHPDPRGEARDDETVAAEGDLGPQVEGTVRQGCVVATLGFQRDPVAQRRRNLVGKGTGANHHLPRTPCLAVGGDHHLLAYLPKRVHLRPLDAAAHCPEVIGECKHIELRITDRIPPGREGAAGKAGREARLDLGHGGSVEMPEFDRVLRAKLPPWQRCLELRLALVDLEVTLLAQHRHRAGAGEKGLELAPGERHQRDLRVGGCLYAARRTGPPELKHPRRDVERIGRRHRQGPERIEEPLRRLAHDAGRRHRQDVGEGEGTGIAGRGTGGGAFTVEDRDRQTARLRGDGG
jgi:hypothetical protein